MGKGHIAHSQRTKRAGKTGDEEASEGLQGAIADVVADRYPNFWNANGDSRKLQY